MIVLYLILAAIGTGLFTNFSQWMLGNPIEGPVKTGRVGSWLGEFLRQRYLAREKVIDAERARRLNAEFERKQAEQPEVPLEKFKAKPYHAINWWKMPICPRCLNFWQSLATLVVMVAFGFISPWWFLAVTMFMGFADAGVLISSRLTP